VLQGFDVILPGEQIMNLQEIEPPDTPELDASIWLGPLAAADIQTLSAANSAGGLPSFSSP
jgi:hypothetical protein